MSEKNIDLNKVGKDLMKWRIAQLLLEGVSENVIVEQLVHSSFVLDDTIKITIKEYFLEDLKKAVENKNFYLATVLTATIIEHLINEFYITLLNHNYVLAKNEIEKMLRVDFKDKLTWLLKVTTKYELDEKTIYTLTQINSKRNGLVHYRPHSLDYEFFDKSYIDIMVNSCNIVSDFESCLNEIILNEVALSNRASAIFDKYFGNTNFVFENTKTEDTSNDK